MSSLIVEHKIKNDFLENFLILLIIFITANASSLLTDSFILVISIFLGFIFFLKRYKIDKIIIIVIIYFLFINLISFYYNKTTFNKITFLGFILKIIYSYFLLKIIGENIFYKLEKIIFLLTLISIPIFIIQFFFPSLFYSLSNILNFITRDEQKKIGGWYVIFYMFSAWFPHRNSGFMWEPGAFAFMILLGMSIYFSYYGKIIINKRIIVYIIALILTFSTMGYLALFLLLTYYFVQRKKFIFIIFALPFLVPLLKQFFLLDFIAPKLNLYFHTLGNYYNVRGAEYIKGSRFTYFLFAIQQTLIWPLGYGIVPSKNMFHSFYSMVNGVGTISKILIYWGWIGIIFFVFSIIKFYKVLFNKFDNNIIIVSIILLIAFFSNPLEKSPILFIILFYPYIYRNLKNARRKELVNYRWDRIVR